jgi:outer membrane protein
VKRTLICCTLITWLFLTAIDSSGFCAAHAAEQQSVLTLDEAIQHALANNRSLNRARLGLESNQITYSSQQEEFQLKIVPAVQTGYSSDSEEVWRAGASFSRRFSTGVNLSLDPFVGGQNRENQAGVEFRLDLPLLRGAGKEFALDGVQSSLYAYQDATLSFHSQQAGTVLQTVQAVYRALLNDRQIDLQERQLTALQAHLALAKIKEKAGVITAIDLYRAEIRIKNVENGLTLRRESRANTLDELKRLLALSQSGDITITAPISYQPITLEETEAVNIALANRIELEQTRRRISETERQLVLAEKNLLPQLDLQLGYSQTGEDLEFGFDEEIWTARLSSNTDLFRRSEKNAYTQKRISYRQIQLDQLAEREQIIQEVRAQLNTLDKQLQRIVLREEQLHQTRGKMLLAESKFRNGMADNFDLIEAQTEMQNAENEHLVEQINYILQTYQLRSTLGTLLAYREKDDEETP